MWFSQKTKDTPYKLSYAQSRNGLHWSREDVQLPEVSYEGWDSEMICYPYVVWTDQYKCMFYNGNGYGATGIGYAEWE
jgi:hypothetical protein